MRHSFTIADAEHAVWLSRHGDEYVLQIDERAVAVALAATGPGTCRLTVDGEATEIMLASDGDLTHVHLDGASFTVRYTDPVLRHAGHAGGSTDDVAQAPMPGVAIAVHVAEGEHVARGTTLLVIESMKLETAIKASRDGTVETVHVAAGQTFERGAALVTLTPEPGS